MNFTKDEIKEYINERNKLERILVVERAVGSVSKKVLRRIEELDRIIHYDDYKLGAKELRNKLSHYEEYKTNYKKQIIVFLKDNISANEQAMKQYKEESFAYEHLNAKCYAYYKTLKFVERLSENE